MEISRKELCLVAFVIILLGVYVVYFTDWFKTVPIHIEHSVRPYVSSRRMPGAAADGEQLAYSITFALGQDYQLTSVKVVSAAAFAADPNARALWHLVGDSKSAPTSGFAYGQPIAGMKSFVAGSVAQPLAAGTPYHVIVQAGRLKGEHDFTISSAAAGGR